MTERKLRETVYLQNSMKNSISQVLAPLCHVWQDCLASAISQSLCLHNFKYLPDSASEESRDNQEPNYLVEQRPVRATGLVYPPTISTQDQRELGLPRCFPQNTFHFINGHSACWLWKGDSGYTASGRDQAKARLARSSCRCDHVLNWELHSQSKMPHTLQKRLDRS